MTVFVTLFCFFFKEREMLRIGYVIWFVPYLVQHVLSYSVLPT